MGRGRTPGSGGAGELPPSAFSPGAATCLRRSRLSQGPLPSQATGLRAPGHPPDRAAEPLGALRPRQRLFLPAPRRARCVASQRPGPSLGASGRDLSSLPLSHFHVLLHVAVVRRPWVNCCVSAPKEGSNAIFFLVRELGCLLQRSLLVTTDQPLKQGG